MNFSVGNFPASGVVESCFEDEVDLSEIAMWSVYGHKTGEGLHCIHDFKTKNGTEVRLLRYQALLQAEVEEAVPPTQGSPAVGPTVEEESGCYMVEMNFTYGWDDVGFKVDDKPQRFETVLQAKQAIAEFIADCDMAVDEGFMEDGFSKRDFRVVPVKSNQELQSATKPEQRSVRNRIPRR